MCVQCVCAEHLSGAPARAMQQRRAVRTLVQHGPSPQGWDWTRNPYGPIKRKVVNESGQSPDMTMASRSNAPFVRAYVYIPCPPGRRATDSEHIQRLGPPTTVLVVVVVPWLSVRREKRPRRLKRAGHATHRGRRGPSPHAGASGSSAPGVY